MKNVLIVFFGGGLGSLMRYFVNRWISGFVTVLYPSGTFVANITGCFLIGFFIFYTERLGPNALNWRLFLVTGLCGGYTTFSSFSFENVQMITNHQLFNMLFYTLASIVLGFFATYTGILLARTI